MIKYDNENHKKNIPNGKVARAIVLTTSTIDRTLRALYLVKNPCYTDLLNNMSVCARVTFMCRAISF